MVIGVMAVLDMAGAGVAVSAYFAAALVTIALGLIVGAWFGRARGLIALALLATLGLVVSTGTERWGGELGDSVYRPATHRRGRRPVRLHRRQRHARPARASTSPGRSRPSRSTMKVGQLRVLLPADGGHHRNARGRRTAGPWSSARSSTAARSTGRAVTDLGADGAGGGTLRLDLQMDTGNVEVIR